MNVTDAVYRQWSEELDDKPDTPEMKRAYTRLRKELNTATVMTNAKKDDIWEAAVGCMAAVQELAFKEGFIAGMQIMNEAR